MSAPNGPAGPVLTEMLTGPVSPFAGNRANLPISSPNAEADARTRTGDPFITSEVLYQLSYVGAGGIVAPELVSQRLRKSGDRRS